MSIPLLTLQTDKNTTSVDVDRITIRQSESGLVLRANLVNSSGSAYDLTNCKVSFGENKNGGKMVDDDNIDIINAKAGQVSYKLHTTVYQESGSAWFEIEDDANVLIDTTTNFFIEVLKQAELPVDNDNYWSKAEQMLTHVQALLQKAQNDLTNLTDTQTQKVNDAINGFNAQINDAKSNLEKFENDFKNQSSQDFKNFEDSLKNDLNNKISDINSAISTIKNTTIPDLNSRLSQIDTKITTLNNQIKSIDFTKFVKTVNGKAPDANGNVNVDTGNGTGSLKQITINGGSPISPDSSGTAALQVPMYAANLLSGTSRTGQKIPNNTATDIVHLTTLGNTKYTVAIDLDFILNNGISLTYYGGKLQVNNGGTVVESSLVNVGSKKRVSVTFTTPSDCLWVTILVKSNTSYNGQYSCLKASQWQDNDTPPDMTWAPSIDDISSSGLITIAKDTNLSTLKTPGAYYSENGSTDSSLSSSISDPVYLFVLPYSSGATLQILMGGSISNSGGFIPAKYRIIFPSVTIAWRDLLRDINQLNYVVADLQSKTDTLTTQLGKKVSTLANPDRSTASYDYVDVDNPTKFLGGTQLNGSTLQATKNVDALKNVNKTYSLQGALVVDQINFAGGTVYLEFLFAPGSDNLYHVFFRKICPSANDYVDRFRQLDSDS